MALTRLCRLAVAALLVQLSFAQYDPLADFCRRFGQQTAVIDRRLFIDGGQINYQQNPTNYTNTYLLYANLDVDNQHMPQEYDNLTKGSQVPSLSGGILWADTVNKVLYLYGGESTSSAQPFSLWAYDAIYNQWNQTVSDTSDISPSSYGAGVAVNDRGVGYYYGGWMSNATIPNWAGPPIASSYLLSYDMIQNRWTNITGPDNTGRAEGVMVYIPASDGGMLVYFGGVETSSGSGNGSFTGVPMSEIHLYDIANDRWYTQTATGDIPGMRRRFCAGVTWAQDHSSYNVYLYGGLGMPNNNSVGYDDVYILSMPSFTWIKWWSTNQTYPHHSLTCNVIDNSQMIIMGGTFPNASSTQCDAQVNYGMHNLNLGKQNEEDAMWYYFLPNVTSYQVPPEITKAVGGGATGGATLTTPTQGWNSNDLSVYFTRVYAAATRTPTRAIPVLVTNGTSSNHTSSESHTNVGAIAGGTVGGVVALVAVGVLIFCLRRRSKNKAQRAAAGRKGQGYPSQTMAELPNPDPSSPRSHYSNVHKPVLSPTGQELDAGYPLQTSPGWSSRADTNTPWPDNRSLHELGRTSSHPQPYYPPPQQLYYPPPLQIQPHLPPPMPTEMPSVRSPVNVYEASEKDFLGRQQSARTQYSQHSGHTSPRVTEAPSPSAGSMARDRDRDF